MLDEKKEEPTEPEIRDNSEDNCTCCGSLPLKCQVLSYSVLVLALFITHLVHMFWIGSSDELHEWFYLIYLISILPNVIALVLYATYFCYGCNCYGAVGCCGDEPEKD